MVARISGFQWDRGNWPKCGKHGVSRAEIEALFSGNFAVHPDLAHSGEEEGTSRSGPLRRDGRSSLCSRYARSPAGS